MAATFEVETGTGSATANAYATEAECDQYHENYGDPAAWSGATSAAKQDAIREATRYMDALYGSRWKGWATNRLQRLDWPRANVEIRDGFMIEPTEMPTELKDACAAIALEVIGAGTTSLLPSLASGSGGLKAKSAGVGSLRTSKEYLGGSREAPEFPMIDGIIASLIKGGGGVGVLRRG